MKEQMRKFTEQELVRREKYKKLCQNNNDPFLVTQFIRTHNSEEFKQQLNIYDKQQLEEKQASIKIAGRIRNFREAGKAVFISLQDQYGHFQVYIRSDEIDADEFETILDLDLGDFIGVIGIAMKTNTGELTVRVNSYILLTKTLKPLPDKYYGTSDIEEKYRRRYVDLIISDDSKNTFIKRTKILQSMREFLNGKTYLEVETPILQAIHGGASAKPFTTHHNALDMSFYLRVAPELNLKQLIVGGFEGVYEIGRLFRNEGMSNRHNPEFTSMELYIAYQNMDFMINLVEDMFCHISKTVLNGKTAVEYENTTIFFDKPWKRWHMVDAIKEICNIDFWQPMTFDEAKAIALKNNLHVPPHFTGVGHIINLFFEEFIEAKIIQPTFVYGHPVEISPLAKKNAEDSRFTDRFELFILAREYANGFSELNNPIDQYERFVEQLKEKEQGNDEAQEMDIDFIEALEYGLPPTVGLGVGIDRLTMLLTGQNSIKDVLLFPHMRPRGK